MGKKGQLTKTTSALPVPNESLHWTERSIDDFVHRITFDFVTQVDDELIRTGASHADLAEKLRVTKGRVSQIINSPANISLRNVVKYARAVGRKVALVLYDDNDSYNKNGPISSSVFSRCWEMAGRPSDFFQLAEAGTFWTVSVSVTSNYYLVQGTAYGTMLDSAAQWSTVALTTASMVGTNSLVAAS